MINVNTPHVCEISEQEIGISLATYRGGEKNERLLWLILDNDISRYILQSTFIHNHVT